MSVSAQPKNFKVIIIGGGIAGLSAYARLIEKGIKADDILLIEAGDRLGGRINTFELGLKCKINFKPKYKI